MEMNKQNVSRWKMTKKNVFYGYVASFFGMLLTFISRTIFIKYLGQVYLGINGLFSNVLGILSFAELGIGTAMNFSLYKPVAENDKEEIKSIMELYKILYRVIALIVAILGIILVPFLKYIVKDPGNVGDIRIYYLIFLFNTVITYLVSYKFSLVNAEQKNYMMTNINMLCTTVTTVLQIAVIVMFKNFLVYLLTASVFGVVQKLYINWYLNKCYPYLMDKNVKKISKEKVSEIKQNVKGLIYGKIGEVAVYQTDNILISSFINVGTVGLVSNYNVIINSVNTLINIMFNAVVGSLGNFMARETKEKQYNIFKIYRFCGFYVFGFASIAFLGLCSKFIRIWIGEKMIIPQIVVALLSADYYLKGQRVCINNLKSAGGFFYEDRFVSIMQATVNLIVSIALVIKIGLPGVYIGTVVQGLMSNIIRPVIIYKKMFNVSSVEYFKDSAKYLIAVIIAFALYTIATNLISIANPFAEFIVSCILLTVITNATFLILFAKTDEEKYMLSVLKTQLLKKG